MIASLPLEEHVPRHRPTEIGAHRKLRWFHLAFKPGSHQRFSTNFFGNILVIPTVEGLQSLNLAFVPSVPGTSDPPLFLAGTAGPARRPSPASQQPKPSPPPTVCPVLPAPTHAPECTNIGYIIKIGQIINCLCMSYIWQAGQT